MLRYLNGFDFYAVGAAEANAVADGFFGRTTQMFGSTASRFSHGSALKTQSTIFFNSNFYEAVGQRFTTETCVIGQAVFIPKSIQTLPAYSYGFGVYDAEGGVDLQMNARFTETGVIRIFRGDPDVPANLVATTPADSFHFDEWIWLECKVKIHPTDGLFEIRVNTVVKASFIGDTNVGTPVLSLAPGWDTLVWTNGAINSITTDIFWDDVYLLDDTGAHNTDYLGNVRVNAQFAVAPGDLTQFGRVGAATSNWDAVNDTALTDAQYVYDGTAGEMDLYTMNPNVTAQNIFGVQIRGAYRQDDSTQMIARNILKTGGTIYEGSDHYLSGSYRYYRDVWELNPNTGVGWTSANLNAIQAGTKVQA